jgi:hypothetical protein
MSDTERLDWVLKQLQMDRDDLDWAIDQDGYLDLDGAHGAYPMRSWPWSPAIAERRANPVDFISPQDFLVERIFPKIPVSPQPGEYHFRKAKS